MMNKDLKPQCIITWTWYEFLRADTFPKEPFFLDIGMHDIDNTIIDGLKNSPEFFVGMSIDFCIGKKLRNKVKEYADKNGLLIEFRRLWNPTWDLGQRNSYLTHKGNEVF